MKPRPFKLPSSVRITSKIKYRVRYVETFDEKSQLGECDYDKRLIRIKAKLGPKKTEEVLWHEICHAFFEANNISLTECLEETIIINIERPLARIMRLNNLRIKN